MKPAPGGESFMDLYNRVCGAIERITIEQAGKDVIAVAHGGTIKAAIGFALGGQPEKGLAFDIDNCSVTRLDHLASHDHAAGVCRWSTSSRGSPMPRTTPCISRRGRKWSRRRSWPDIASRLSEFGSMLHRPNDVNQNTGDAESNLGERYMTLFDMSGKVAVITGSTRGIGRAIAERMAEHGAKVVISSRKQDVCDPVSQGNQ